MTITQERITPKMAQEYLGFNTDNYRKLNSGRVLTYSEDMKSGRWQLNGESIKFSKNGTLMDGQHRLHAIIKAGTPIDMLVIRDLEDNVDVCDIGSVRSLGMIARKRGVCEANHNTIVAIAAFIVGNGDTHKANGNMAILDYMDNHIELLNKAHTAAAVGTKTICRKAPIIAAIYCLIRDGKDLSDIMNFCKIANTGLPTGYYEPSSQWLNIETIDLYVTGHDNEGPLYSGTIFLNGKQYDIRTESDRAELTADIPEGISSLKYYVTDLAGNRSEIIGK